MEKSDENQCEKKDTKVLPTANDLQSPSAEKPVLQDYQSKTSRKRKAFTLSKSYKDTTTCLESNLKRSRTCDSSSDENSSSSRGFINLTIPHPENFLGSNNPFRNITPNKGVINTTVAVRKIFSFDKFLKHEKITNSRSISKHLFHTSSALDFSSKIAALRSTGIFPNISNSDLAKAAGQPRLVRTIKRRLSAKDITIGPNQEVRRRRTRRLSSTIEVCV